MLYKAVAPEGRSEQCSVQECDENKRNICFCNKMGDAELIAGALNLRGDYLRRMAHSFIGAVDDADSSRKLWDNWQGTVKGHGLSEADAKQLWVEIGNLLNKDTKP